jgi:hypothetical protein
MLSVSCLTVASKSRVFADSSEETIGGRKAQEVRGRSRSSGPARKEPQRKESKRAFSFEQFALCGHELRLDVVLHSGIFLWKMSAADNGEIAARKRRKKGEP